MSGEIAMMLLDEAFTFTPDRKWVYNKPKAMWILSEQYKKREIIGEILARFDVGEDGRGITWVDMNDLANRFPEFANQIVGNGSNLFTRGHIGSSFLFDTKRVGRSDGSKATIRKVVGFNERRRIDNSIRQDIRDWIITQPCRVCGNTNNIQPDHRDGRKDDPRVGNIKTQRKNDFQPLCDNCNAVKRGHCNRCRDTEKRFDARTLSYPVGWRFGGEDYTAEEGCFGCYWHCPMSFKLCLSFEQDNADIQMAWIQEQRMQTEM